FGFPLDLTEDILKGQGRSVDNAAFDSAMDEQRTAARKAWSGSGEAATEEVWFDIRDQNGATEFLGYDTEVAEGRIVAIVVDGKPVEMAPAGIEASIVVNQTPFYGESGGQMGDAGEMKVIDGARVVVVDTEKYLGALHVHRGMIYDAALGVGDVVELHVDHARRTRLRANHSATHLLHAALRRELGDHVTQKGSLVAPDRLRFDISHQKPLDAAQIAAVEEIVNSRVVVNAAVDTHLMSSEEAIKAGAMALFGEKYGDEVRVVSMGGPVDEDFARGPAYSVELCGGTHVRRTGDIGLFKIVHESAVSAGVRRIEALTGPDALAHYETHEQLLHEAAETLKSTPEAVPGRVAQLLDERRKLERELTDMRRKLAAGGGGGSTAVDESKDIGGVKFVARSLADVPPRELKSLVDELKDQIGSGIVAVADAYGGKGSIVVGVTPDLVSTISAVDLVRIGVVEMGGKGGGGRPEMAQGGGPDPSKVDAVLEAIEAELKQKLPI
ncbi:MAG: alanine--tRNA ligase-related protein, partial [Alphaproteobacteria bacterium]|nr:alanine--tRNA ligase-related protein [Alphaproteobacteria bacterium]